MMRGGMLVALALVGCSAPPPEVLGLQCSGTRSCGTGFVCEESRCARSFLEWGTVWSFLDVGTAPPEAWTRPDFDDAAWPRGAGSLGYGEIATVTPVGYGPDVSSKYTTTYFRTAFDVDAQDVDALRLQYRRDDGVLFRLNGTELARDNLPPGDLTPATFTVRTAVGEEATLEVHTFQGTAAALVPGLNVLTAEVHQATLFSTDLYLDARLLGLRVITVP